MDWPSLQGQEIAQLKASFKNPQHLEAAFDDDEGARELLRLLLPGIAPEGLEARNADPGEVERSVSKAVQGVEERLLHRDEGNSCRVEWEEFPPYRRLTLRRRG